MRLIDADDLISELASFREKQEDPKNKDIATTVSLFVEVYARTTTPIDISVVRCKDCKWSERTDLFLLCGAWDARAVDDNDFCSSGERRSE